MATKYKRQKDGSYSTGVWDGTYNADGTKHRKQIRSTKSSKDLENKVAAFKRAVDEHAVITNTDILLYDYAKSWSKIYKAKTAYNTQAMYDNVIETHIQPLKITVRGMTRQRLFNLLNYSSDSTGRQIYIALKQIYLSAVRDRILTVQEFDDIFADTSSPKPEKREKRALTPCERNAILKADLNPMDKAYLYIIYGCGLRRGEALALTKQSIDFNKNALYVKPVIIFINNDPRIKSRPKSNNSIRTVPMPKFLSDYLREYIQDLPKEHLFFTKNKELMTKSSYDKMWRRIIKALNKAGAESVGLTSHIFRHNYATTLCYQIPAISIKRIAQLLGDTEKMVLEIYNHIIDEKEDTTGAIEKAVGF